MVGIVEKACTWLSRSALHGLISRHGKAFFSDAMWTFAAKVLMQVSQLGTFIIAARVLTSAEFGLFSYTAALVALLVVVAEGGLREFVMKTTHEEGRVDQIATLALIAGLTAAIIGLAVVAILDYQLKMPGEALLVLLFCLWLAPTPFASVLEGLLIADGRLKELSLIRIAGEVSATLLAVYGLMHGWNIYALAAGKLMSQLVMTLLSMLRLRWLPAINIELSFARELFAFSRHITYNRALVLMRSYSGTLVVGSLLGLADAGYYRAAERIVSAFSDLVSEPARQIAWSTLRKIAMIEGEANTGQPGAPQALGRKATSFVILLMVVSTPIYVGLALMSGTLVDLVLGAAWAPAAILVSLLSLKQILLVPGYVTEPLLSLAGAIRKVPAAILLNSVVSIGLIAVMSPFGVVAAAAGQLIAAVCSFLVSAWLQSRHGAVRWQSVLWGCLAPLIGSVVMAATILGLGDVGPASVKSGLLTNTLQMLAGGLVYVASLALLYAIALRLRPVAKTKWSDGIDPVANRV